MLQCAEEFAGGVGVKLCELYLSVALQAIDGRDLDEIHGQVW